VRSLALSSLIHAGLLGLAVIAGWRVVSAGLRRTEEVVISPALPFVDPFDSTPEPPPLESPPEEAQEKEPKLVEPRFADSYLERSPWELEREFEAPHRGEGFFLDPILDREKPEPSDPPVDRAAIEEPPSGPIITEPILLEAPDPIYPRVSIRRGEQGRVVCRLHIDAQGDVVRVEVVESSGFRRLDDAAVAGLLRWRFQPRTEGGRAVSMSLTHPVSFRLWDS
jgi:protein TonB